jgi:hypothetical protein
VLFKYVYGAALFCHICFFSRISCLKEKKRKEKRKNRKEKRKNRKERKERKRKEQKTVSTRFVLPSIADNR